MDEICCYQLWTNDYGDFRLSIDFFAIFFNIIIDGIVCITPTFHLR